MKFFFIKVILYKKFYVPPWFLNSNYYISSSSKIIKNDITTWFVYVIWYEIYIRFM